jgi:hypothetical protein
MNLRCLRKVHRVIPSRHRNGILVKIGLFAGISSDEFSFDSDFLPVFSIAYAYIFEFFDELLFSDLLFLMIMT